MIDFKELARLILQGWVDSSNAEDAERQSPEFYYKQLVEHPDDADILSLFGHWSNDLLSVFGTAAHIRLSVEIVDGKWTIIDVPDPVIAEGTPLAGYYWSSGSFSWDDKIKNMVWEPGSWKYYEPEIAEDVVVGVS